MRVEDVDGGGWRGYGIVFRMGRWLGLEIGVVYYTTYQLRFFIL